MRILIVLFLLGFTFKPSCLYSQEIQKWLDTEELYKQGLEYLDFSNYQEAKNSFEAYLNKPYNETDNKVLINRSNAQYYSALSSLELGKPDAVLLFLNFIDENYETPLRRVAYYQLGRIYFEKRKYNDAINCLEQVVTSDLTPDQLMEYQYKLGYSRFIKKDFEEAKKLFEPLLSSEDKYYYPSNYYYGLIAYYQEDYETALNYFNVVDQSSVYASIIPYYLAQTNFQLGNYQETIDNGLKLESDPKFKYRKEVLQIIGQSYFELEDYQNAETYLLQYVDLAKKVPKEDLYQLAYAEYKNGDYLSAIESFEEFTVVKGELGQNAMYALADCYLLTNQNDKARTAFQKAGSFDFDTEIQETSKFNFAKLSYELNYQNASITALEEFIKTYPDSKYINEAEELLTEALLSSKNYAKAIEVIQSIDRKSNRIKEAYQKVTYFRASELFADHNYSDASNMLDEAFKYPLDKSIEAKSYFLSAEIEYINKKYRNSILDYEAFLQLSKINDWEGESDYRFKAYYGLGYNYFKLSEFEQAILQFEAMESEYKSSVSAADELMYADGSLRAGDCYFMVKKYDKAILAYDKVLNRSGSGKDYALLQKGLVQGLIKEYQSKLNSLNRLRSEYPQSVYSDLALYEIGRTQQDMSSNQNAITSFKNLIDTYPSSTYRPLSMIQIGVIYYRQGNTNSAIDWFDKVVDEYQNSNASKEALTAIKEIYFEQGDPSGFYDYLDQQGGISYSASEKDSSLYLAAYEKYQLGNIDAAFNDFDNYIASFPNGFFLLPSHFYRGEIYYSREAYSDAVKDYEWIIDNGNSEFAEVSFQKAARIKFTDEDYELANTYYKGYFDRSTTTRNRYEAETGLMRTSYILERYTEAVTYAHSVLSRDEEPPEIITEANFYLGRSKFELVDYDNAKKALEKVVYSSTGSRGAESQYYIALIEYEQSMFDESLNSCFSLSETYGSYEYWVVKAFILIADNYREKGNLFQAKATLESILDNYKGDQELINQAQTKYDEILALEEKNSRIIPENELPPNDSIITIDPNE